MQHCPTVDYMISHDEMNFSIRQLCKELIVHDDQITKDKVCLMFYVLFIV